MQRPLDTQHSVGETLGDLRSTIYLSPSLENIDSVISILNSNCESPNVLVGQLEKSLSWSATVADESVSSRFVAASALTRSKRSCPSVCDRPVCVGVGITPHQHVLSVSVWSDNGVISGTTTGTADLIPRLSDFLKFNLHKDMAQPLSSSCSDLRSSAIDPLKNGLEKCVLIDPLANVSYNPDRNCRKLIMPGSFNPLHVGHVTMLETAKQFLAVKGQFDIASFEISVFNADKPPIADAALLDRLTQFAGRWNCVLTNAPTFIEKARLLPNSTFVLGHDTAIRLLMPKYYGNSEVQMREVFEEFGTLNTRFLVAGRTTSSNAFHTLSDIEFPDHFEFKHLFMSLPSELFRKDVSSTAIRSGLAPADLQF